jgi:hypothetical protein
MHLRAKILITERSVGFDLTISNSSPSFLGNCGAQHLVASATLKLELEEVSAFESALNKILRSLMPVEDQCEYTDFQEHEARCLITDGPESH